MSIPGPGAPSDHGHMKTDDPLLRGGVERGPTATRGLQFSETPADELRERLAKANARLRHLDNLRRALVAYQGKDLDLREISREELSRQRREIFEMQTDLRAELRRRGDL